MVGTAAGALGVAAKGVALLIELTMPFFATCCRRRQDIKEVSRKKADKYLLINQQSSQ
jgi:hypothetical protein